MIIGAETSSDFRILQGVRVRFLLGSAAIGVAIRQPANAAAQSLDVAADPAGGDSVVTA
tara:strand:- start:272 stop:448 length:177 start_codon:yes stop_codon:yes gene_type:complete